MFGDFYRMSRFQFELSIYSDWNIKNVNLTGPITGDRNVSAKFGKNRLRSFQNIMGRSFEAMTY
jgi:hypothetical protein